MSLRLLSSREVRQRLALVERDFRNLQRAGEAPASIRIGRREMYDPADVEAWIAGRKSAVGNPRNGGRR